MTTTAPTVLIISFAFHPSTEIGARRTTALARYLADNGMRVLVVSAFGYQPIASGAELYPGVFAVPVGRPPRPWLDLLVKVKRWISSRTGAQSAQGRVAPTAPTDESEPSPESLQARLRERYFRLIYFIDHFKRWSCNAAAAAIRVGREQRAVLVISSAPPHSTLLSGAWAARRLGVPFVADMRDPWSDTLAVAHPHRRIELRLLRGLESWTLRQAAAVTSTSATAAALLGERYPSLTRRIEVIRNGYDGEIAPPLLRTGGRLSILFAGVLYVRRTPYPLLAALERLISRADVDASRVQLTFMGDKVGSFSDQLLNGWLQGKRCASVVRVLPPQDANAVAREVAQATVLLNLAQQQRLHVPAKTFEQLASGREILLICEDDCETAQVVAGIHGVTRVDHSDPEVLDAVLLDLYRRHAIAGTARVPAEAEVRQFSRALANERFAALLREVAPLADARTLSAAGALPPERYSVKGQVAADVRFYHRLTRRRGSGIVALTGTFLRNRGLWLLAFHRIGHYCVRTRNVAGPAWWLARVCRSFGTCFNVLLCRSEVSDDCQIGAGSYLGNGGYILCGALSIGAGSLIHERCTFGYGVAGGGEGRPTIGRNVWIGPDCIIAGALNVGEGATLLPGSFVTFDVPPRTVVKGNPAMVVRRNFDNSALRSSMSIVPDLESERS